MKLAMAINNANSNTSTSHVSSQPPPPPPASKYPEPIQNSVPSSINSNNNVAPAQSQAASTTSGSGGSMKLAMAINSNNAATSNTSADNKKYLKGHSASTPATASTGSNKCPICAKSVYKMEEILALSRTWHKTCFCCGAGSADSNGCGRTLTRDGYSDHDNVPYCNACYGRLYRPKGVGYGNSLNTEEGSRQVDVKFGAASTTNSSSNLTLSSTTKNNNQGNCTSIPPDSNSAVLQMAAPVSQQKIGEKFAGDGTEVNEDEW
jgi:hypothetical protein